MIRRKTEGLRKQTPKCLAVAITLIFLVLAAHEPAHAQEQSPTPVPTPSLQNNPAAGITEPEQQTRSFAENLRRLHVYSFSFLKQMIEVVEKPSYTSFEFLAKVLAGLVLLFSFLRLIRENDGASKEL